ncbi:MAG: 3'(2'),5'-bisphosphate nucleotidase CysQ [Bacteroidales bacterium]
MITRQQSEHLLEIAIAASLEAGEEIRKIYTNGFDVDYKKDHSPLTKADTASHAIISKHIEATGYPVLSEEGREIRFEKRKTWDIYWLVDPLDGTKEFVKKNGEFTVNIALIVSNQPMFGVIYIPVTKTLYFGSEFSGSHKIHTITGKRDNLDTYIKEGIVLPEKQSDHVFTVVGSKSHLTPETEVFVETLKKKHGALNFLSKGSSLKICMVAEGSADVYPRFAPTMEWDIAAGHAIAKYSGAQIVVHETGHELTYNTESLVNPWFIVKR